MLRVKQMASSHRWAFKARLRANAYGWRASRLAIKRLKEAVSEIKKAARSDPVLAGEGTVALMERLWPALQGVDGSSGALGNAVGRTLRALIPILIAAPAKRKTRERWLDRLYEAVEEDGVSYLSPVEDEWGEICGCRELASEWADRILPLLRESWSADEAGGWVVGSSLCLSSLLKAERYGELQEVLSLKYYHFWPSDKFWAEALLRQGRTDEAIAYAEAQRRQPYDERAILRFCERALLDAGRREEAYSRYGLQAASGITNLAVFRETAKSYPERDRREILLDLIEARGDRGKWFAAAKDAGYLDIALQCASLGTAEPRTLVRAARDFSESQPVFAAQVALKAIEDLLEGCGYEPTALDIARAHDYLMKAARSCGKIEWAMAGVQRLLARGSPPHDQLMRQALASHAQQMQGGEPPRAGEDAGPGDGPA